MNKLFEILNNDARRVIKNTDLNTLKGKSILITGASGLLGVNLISALKTVSEQAGDLTVYPVIYSEPGEFLKKLFDFPGVKYYKGDLTSEEFCKGLPEADYIIHAAGYAQPLRFMADPLKTFKLNAFSTIYLFEKLKHGGKFLYISSSEVYNGLDSSEFSENEIGNTNTTHPRACYIEGKKGGETICAAYRQRGIDAMSVRLSLVYGPGTRKSDKRVLQSFIEKALGGKINLLDRGEAKRTYCYITDAIELLWRILLSGKEPVYNLGGDSKVTILELAEKIGNYLNAPVVVPESNDGVSGAPKEVRLDLSLLKKEFNKVDFVPLDEGIKNTIEWYKNLENHF